MEERMNKRIGSIENTLAEHQEKIDFFVRTSLPPHQGIFYDGQIFDAYTFINDRIREATTRIILIDNYIDDNVLTILSKRADKVAATIYTKKPSAQLQLDIQKHNAQYPPISVVEFNRSHDRFLCIDETVYHLGQHQRSRQEMVCLQPHGNADNRIIAKNIIDCKHSLAYLDIFLYLCNLNSFLIV